MKSLIIQLLELKGISIPNTDHEELTDLWEIMEFQKQTFDKKMLEESDISFRTIPGGDPIE